MDKAGELNLRCKLSYTGTSGRRKADDVKALYLMRKAIGQHKRGGIRRLSCAKSMT